jgi:hypothetical protein
LRPKHRARQSLKWGELGARFDNRTVLGTIPLMLCARVVWAHDRVTNPALAAVFQSLPAASFVVNGAARPDLRRHRHAALFVVINRRG